jgi:two-component system, NarL family, sensor histidine kinase UhpB
VLALVESHVLLKSLTLSPADELYLFDAKSLDLVEMNSNAEKALEQNASNSKVKSIEKILGIKKQLLLSHINAQKSKESSFEISANQPLQLTSMNSAQLRVMLIQSDTREYVLVTRTEFVPSEKVVMALSESEMRFQAIVSNIPGLVFQMGLDEEDTLYFTYVSNACHALLGVSEEELLDDSDALLTIMNARDRADLKSKLRESAQSLEKLDWEGRVWIDGWQDTKWINLRASTRKLDNGHTMWDGIMLNITQSKREKQEIEQSRRDLEKLNAHMSHIKEQERISIAREIHDDLGGNLTAIKMSLAGMLQHKLSNATVTIEHIKEMESIVNRTFEAVHRISGNLRPSVLDLGIVDALEWQVMQFKKQVNFDTKFITNQAEISLSTEQAMALFRICQESLSNIAKYAKATEVVVDIKCDNGDVILSILDNGIGIKAEDKLKENSFGLRGMQERVSGLHGELSIISPCMGEIGTKISVKIPV